ncbi:hypothetical protein C1H46_032655 [Malus baccata]|uniref:Uncharacterized protein n=1 Tax=Malus baccata TaxID=106549 RepID=A0A540L5Q1_MALBA|nr:hypothetical protein C1H46_032655 [Malus baccata]
MGAALLVWDTVWTRPQGPVLQHPSPLHEAAAQNHDKEARQEDDCDEDVREEDGGPVPGMIERVKKEEKKKKNQGPVDPAQTGPFQPGRVRSDSYIKKCNPRPGPCPPLLTSHQVN